MTRTFGRLTDVTYSWATIDAGLVGSLPLIAADPLPTIVEPLDQPTVDHPLSEPLIELTVPRVKCLNVYHRAGWTEAVDRTWVRAEVAERLGWVVGCLPERFGLAVFDGWRPLALQKQLYDAGRLDPVLPEEFIAYPSTDPRRPVPHTSGGAVDVTLTWNGIPLGLGTDFDDFTDRAAITALEREPGVARELRRLLFWAMHSAGFVALPIEWWHFEFGTNRWAAVTRNVPFYGPADPPAA